MVPKFIFLSFITCLSFTSELKCSQYLNEKYKVGGYISEIVACKNSIELDNDSGSFRSLIKFINSSSSIHSVLLGADEHSLALVDRNSILYAINCIIEISTSNSSSLFRCDGEIKVEMMDIHSVYSMQHIFEGFSCAECISDMPYSSVQVISSLFQSVKVTESEGGLISGVDIGREAVIGCSFENISQESPREKGVRRRLFRREECIVSDSLISGGEDGIYGVIVSGIQQGTVSGYSLECSNSTFIECHRSQLHQEVEMNEDYSDESFASRISLSNTSSHTFINCTFTHCSTTTTNISSSSSSGGALSFYSSSATIYRVTITHCIFTSCTAYGWGGAIYCVYSASDAHSITAPVQIPEGVVAFIRRESVRVWE